MPRPKGLPKTGGRQAGTPNKDNPLKKLLATHSLDYFTQNIAPEDANIFFPNDAAKADFINRYQGRLFSQYEIDCLSMKASDRARLEVDILAYHTPKMQAISADLAVQATNRTLVERIQRLASGEDIPSDVEE